MVKQALAIGGGFGGPSAAVLLVVQTLPGFDSADVFVQKVLALPGR